MIIGLLSINYADRARGKYLIEALFSEKKPILQPFSDRARVILTARAVLK